MPRINSQDEVLDMLRTLTDEFGMSQTAVAKNLRLSRTSVINVMNGRTAITQNFIDRMNNFIDKLKNEIQYE
jgi:plasmid maintenance system antidote protein VapI